MLGQLKPSPSPSALPQLDKKNKDSKGARDGGKAEGNHQELKLKDVLVGLVYQVLFTQGTGVLA